MFYFNPRSREGSDSDASDRFSNLAISIHAPAKGATVDRVYCVAVKYISIHAPAKGATAPPVATIIIDTFQSTLPRRERRHGQHFMQLSGRISIHAPAKGATMDSIQIYAGLDDFNPRSREGSDRAAACRR